MALIKIVRVKKVVDGLIKFIQDDFNNAATEQESFLYRILGDNVEGDYDFYTQGKDIFIDRTKENPRAITTSLMFNKNTKGTPHVHIREVAKPKGQFNSVGGLNGETLTYQSGGSVDVYRDTKNLNYEILATSLNPLDTIVISEVLYALLWGAYETLGNEFSTFALSIKELVFQDHMANSLYVRAINIEGQQENEIPSILTNELIDNINFNLKSINGQDLTP